MKSIILFAGPSLFGSGIDIAAHPDIDWRPPARRGDIERLVKTWAGEPGVIALADGTFHSYPSVRHIEIRKALELGWQVWGLCSMGAIRVSEMRHMGMKPWGRVADRFCADPEFADDEVALMHGNEAPFLPLSEPLVHIREFLVTALLGELLTAAEHESILSSLKHRWYGERTLALLRQIIRQECRSVVHEALLARVADFRPYQLKQQDLASFVRARPWEQVPAQAAAAVSLT